MATPHVSPAYPTSPDTIDALMAELRPLSPVELLAGAEVAHEPALELPDDVLRRLTLGVWQATLARAGSAKPAPRRFRILVL